MMSLLTGCKQFSGIRSFIDDIVLGAKTWAELCEKLRWFLERMEKWGIGISLPKSFFGKQSIEILAHRLSADSLATTPKTHSKDPRNDVPSIVERNAVVPGKFKLLQ